MEKNIHDYEDIINLPHHQSAMHPHMSIHDRAAQFSPFSVLKGYDGAIDETARLTDRKIELDEYEKESLDEKLQLLQENPRDCQVSITYFQPDQRKTGGSYLSLTGNVKKIDVYKRIVLMQDGTEIPINDILDIQIC